MIMNSVHQIEIRNEQSKNLLSISLSNIIPLNQLTKFVLHFYYDDFSEIIKLIQCISNIHTFEIGCASFL